MGGGVEGWAVRGTLGPERWVGARARRWRAVVDPVPTPRRKVAGAGRWGQAGRTVHAACRLGASARAELPRGRRAHPSYARPPRPPAGSRPLLPAGRGALPRRSRRVPLPRRRPRRPRGRPDRRVPSHACPTARPAGRAVATASTSVATGRPGRMPSPGRGGPPGRHRRAPAGGRRGRSVWSRPPVAGCRLGAVLVPGSGTAAGGRRPGGGVRGAGGGGRTPVPWLVARRCAPVVSERVGPGRVTPEVDRDVSGGMRRSG